MGASTGNAGHTHQQRPLLEAGWTPLGPSRAPFSSTTIR